jgi:hypothetical protein
MELVDQLVQQLGVSNEQAEGGAGLLLKMAKEKLGSDDFSQIAGLIPGIDELLGKAPSGDAAASPGGGIMEAIGGIAKSIGMGDIGEKLEGLAGVAGGFGKLDLDTEMVSKFATIIIEFLKKNGGETVEAILKSVFK